MTPDETVEAEATTQEAETTTDAVPETEETADGEVEAFAENPN